ncbi:MAG: ABC transporter permease [Devosia sp.]
MTARRWRREAVLALALLAALAIFESQSEHMVTVLNLTRVAESAVEPAILAAGLTLVILIGGIDVSVGAILAVAAVVTGSALAFDLPAVVAVAVAILSGTALGAFNGVVVARLAVPPIIATLGSLYVFGAIVFLTVGTTWITGLPESLSPLVQGQLLGVPAAVLAIGAVYALAWFVLRQTRWGLHLAAIGSNATSARLAGIPVTRRTIETYALLGALAGFAAVLYVARLRNVEFGVGAGLTFEAIAASVLGGADLRGGNASLVGTLLGILFIKVVQNGLVLSGATSLWAPVVTGLLLILVLVVDGLQKPARRRW